MSSILTIPYFITHALATEEHNSQLTIQSVGSDTPSTTCAVEVRNKIEINWFNM